MATAANGPDEKRVEQHEPRIPLTPTGLLMEGHSTQIATCFESLHIISIEDVRGSQPSPSTKMIELLKAPASIRASSTCSSRELFSKFFLNAGEHVHGRHAGVVPPGQFE